MVTFGVGGWSKTLRVSGDRHWEELGPSRARPFQSQPIAYEHAFGGPGFDLNPVGVGMQSVSIAGVAVTRLPNVEAPEHPLASARSIVAPAGFGPVRRHWAPRRSYTGTYDARWREQRWPWVPADYDFAHDNSAPADMQQPYLRGDEALRLSNLHPRLSIFTSALPGLRVRAFVAEARAAGVRAPQLRELSLNIDTLWIDADSSTLVLVWRGVLALESQDASEVGYLYVTEEPLGAVAETLGTKQASFAALLDVGIAEDALEMASPAPVEDDDTEGERLLSEAEQKVHAQMRAAGIDPDALPELTLEQKQADAQRLLELGFEVDGQDDETEPWTRARVEREAAKRASFAGAALGGLDLSALNLSGLDFSGADLRQADLKATMLAGATLDGADLAGANLEAAELSGARFVSADLTAAKLAGARGSNAVFDGALLEAASFVGAQLEGLSARRASGARVSFSRAQIPRANLDAANLPACVFEEANLRDASLRETTIEGALATRLDARGADMTEVRAAEGTILSGARLDGVRAAGANFEAADLAGAVLSGALLTDANLSRARLNGADLSSAILRTAKLASADLTGARLISADLFEADLEGARATGADFSAANLYGAETWKMDLAGARFTGANFFLRGPTRGPYAPHARP